MDGNVFRARISVDIYLKAKDEASARAELAGLTLEQIEAEADAGSYVGSGKRIEAIDLIPANGLDEELSKVASSADFFDI